MTELTLDQVLTQRREAQQDIVNVDEPTVRLLVFTLGNEWFAFHGQRIQEILAGAHVHFVPGCPPSLEGVINVRGDIESVIRLNEMLRIPESAGDSGSSILLGRGEAMSSGIRVDQVVDVLETLQSNIQPPPANLPEHLRQLVLGVLNLQGRPVAVLDLEKIFSDYAQGLG